MKQVTPLTRGEGSVKVEELPGEIEAAKTAAKACKKATRKIPALLQKLRVLKVQFGTRVRSECDDHEESAAMAQELAGVRRRRWPSSSS